MPVHGLSRIVHRPTRVASRSKRYSSGKQDRYGPRSQQFPRRWRESLNGARPALAVAVLLRMGAGLDMRLTATVGAARGFAVGAVEGFGLRLRRGECSTRTIPLAPVAERTNPTSSPRHG